MMLPLFYFFILICTVTNKRQRLTTDERECALVFVQNGVTFTDCTTGLTPDGKTQSKEWCYVDSKYSFNLEKGIKNWGFCNPILEYDKLREYANERYSQLTITAIKTRQQIEAFLGPSQELIKTFNKVNDLNQENKMLIDKLQKDYNFIQQNKKLWAEDLQKVKDLKKRKEELQAKIENKKELIATSTENKNCDGLIGYEDESNGEGLNCYFYQNENFMGNKNPRDFKSMDIKFSKSDSSIENFENFSLEMDGFIKAPSDGKYFFSVKCDDFCIIYINDLLIQDSYKKTEEKKEIFLLGLKKYKIQIKYSHSVHNLYEDYDKAFLKVRWEIEKLISEEEIGLKYLYKSNKMAPLKISGFDTKVMEEAIFKDFRNAYKDEELFKLADIPLEFQGMKMLKIQMGFTGQEIKLKSSSPSIVYIGIPFNNKNEFTFLDPNFHNTQRIFTVLRMPKKQGKSMKAQESIKYIIFERKFEQAEISIHLQKDQKTGINWIIFYKQNMNSQTDFLSCGGQIEELSSPKGQYFKRCTESTSYPTGDFGCQAGLSGTLSDEEGHIWASDNEGPGAYLQIDFNQIVQMTTLTYLNRESIGQRTKILELQYADGMTRLFPLRNIKSPNILSLNPPIISNYLTTIIHDVYSSGNNGGAIKIMGIVCKKNKFQGSTENLKDERTIQAKCLDTLSNNIQIQNRQPTIGQSFQVFCEQPCNDKESPLYGDKVFSPDSSLCKAAYYMSLIKSQGGIFLIKIIQGLEVYLSATGESHILSNYQKGSTQQLSFQTVKLEDKNTVALNEYFLGQKVDLYDPHTGQWLAAIITTLQMIQQGTLKLSLTKPGYDTSFDETLLLNRANLDQMRRNKIDICGSQLTQRVCDSRSKQAGQSSSFLKTYRVCFTVLDKCQLNDQYTSTVTDQNQQAYVDNGDMYGQKEDSLYYGWNRRMNANLRQRSRGKSFIENNLALFPPDPKSKWCTDSHDIDCEQAFWQITLPKGSYQIKITMGDSEYNSKYFLRINEQVIARGLYLRKNQWYTSDNTLLVTDNQKLKVWADCDKDCSEIWSRMSFIQISQIAVTPLTDSPIPTLEKLGCGVSFKNGYCITGPQVINCIYENAKQPGVEHCYNQNQLTKIPQSYHCVELRGMFKCIKKEYGNAQECQVNCPGKCVGKICKTN